MPGAMNNIDIHLLKEAVIEAIWIQWRSLGSFIDTGRLARTIVDPEALLLVSLALRHRERRLWDIAASWARNGSRLFSLQRVKNLMDRFPDLTRERLSEFAHRAKAEGNDFRWQSLAGAEPGPSARKQALWEAYPSNWHPSALVLRLRLGIGVGVVSDLLSFLISLQGGWASARLIAQALDYSVYSIRRVADDMASAQLIESTQAKPVQYRVKVEAWRKLLGIGSELPEWHFWHQVYSFACKAIIADESGDWEGLSSYLLSTKLRDLVTEHQDALILNRIDLLDPTRYTGEEYLPAFAEMTVKLAEWIKNEV
jgi:hypothetical protein